MTIAFIIIVAAMYLAIAGLVALNSVFEAKRSALGAADLAVIALVAVSWPVILCALLSVQAGWRLFARKRELLPVAR